MERPDIESNHPPRMFPATRWTMVIAAGSPEHPETHDALNQLCSDYWYPLYAFVRRRGNDVHQAKDLTQAFFERLLETNALRHVQRERGKFRTFLLSSIVHFLQNEWEREQRLKRGGGQRVVSWDFIEAENQFAAGLDQTGDPHQGFDRDWARALVAKVMDRLRAEHASPEEAQRFSVMAPYLTIEPGPGAYDEATRLLMIEKNHFRVALHRLRRRFGDLLRGEVAETVASPEDVDDEIRNLFAALGS